jgi:hypothetical protein
MEQPFSARDSPQLHNNQDPIECHSLQSSDLLTAGYPLQQEYHGGLINEYKITSFPAMCSCGEGAAGLGGIIP